MNFENKFCIVFFVFFTVFSCSNDDNNNINSTAINLVTGVNARSNFFSEAFRLGNPNVRMPLSIASVSVITYPNPVIDFLTIEIFQTTDVITDVWLVRAEANKIFQDTNFDEILTENTYSVNEISQASFQSYRDLSNNNVSLDLDGIETGYYRVFIKTNESLYWDNIYIDNNSTNITELFDSWE